MVKTQKWYHLCNMKSAYFPTNRRLHSERESKKERQTEIEKDRERGKERQRERVREN